MIELVPAENDDLAFLSLAQQIVNGAVEALQMHEVYLVHINNWFDHKWLGWWSWEVDKELCIPPFNPNRVRSQKYFIRDATNSRWTLTGPGKPLHLRQPGRRSSCARMIDQISKSAAFIWYSGNTVANPAGSVMLYLSGAGGYAWYASFMREKRWKVDDEFRITRRELVSFEEGGREMELAQA